MELTGLADTWCGRGYVLRRSAETGQIALLRDHHLRHRTHRSYSKIPTVPNSDGKGPRKDFAAVYAVWTYAQLSHWRKRWITWRTEFGRDHCKDGDVKRDHWRSQHAVQEPRHDHFRMRLHPRILVIIRDRANDPGAFVLRNRYTHHRGEPAAIPEEE